MESRYKLSHFLAVVLLSVALTLPLTLLARHLTLQNGDRYAVDTLKCSDPLNLKIMYEQARGAVKTSRGGGVDFQGNGWVGSPLCRPGSLSLEVLGRGSLGEAAKLTVLLDRDVLFDGGIEGRKKINLNIDKPGHLFIGFTNDYYKSSVRKAALYSLHMVGENGCRGFEELNAGLSGGVWSPETQTFVLAYDPAPVIKPCGAGRMIFSLYGEPVNDVAAEVMLMQAGSPLLDTRATRRLTPFSLRVGGEAIELRLTNPYGRIDADRSLTLSKITYLPQPLRDVGGPH